MASKPIQPSSNNPEMTFKSALAAVQGRRGHRRSPIAARNVPIAQVHSEEQMEKRALTDAARALAQLWKLSPNLVR
jgi:hypothetical protein